MPHARSVTRVEPKILLANERTFINWLEMATKIGSFSAALAGPPRAERRARTCARVRACAGG